MTTENIKSVVELALLAAGQPLDMRALQRVVGAGEADAPAADIRQAVATLREEWSPRALQLIESAGGYQFISRLEFMENIRQIHPQRAPRLSRALMEILAIIAYRQPVTRGDVEDLRGISVASSQLAFLEEQGWVEEVGHRETPGRPALYATTKEFLDDLGLSSLDGLPSLAELEEEATDNPELIFPSPDESSSENNE